MGKIADKVGQVTGILIFISICIPNYTALPTKTSSDRSVDNNEKEAESSGPIPFLASEQLPKKCKAGTTYRIGDAKDLFKYNDELECIFQASLSPTKVPEGAMIGDVLNFFDSHLLNPLIRRIWTGKFTEKFICNGSEVYRGWNKVAGNAHFAFTSTIGKIPNIINLHPSEYKDNRESVIINYGEDIEDICPDFGSIVEGNKDKVTVSKPSRNKSFFPLNQILDVIRLVGKQSDGGLIYLGKMFVKNQFRSKQLSEVYSFFSVVNYDQSVNTDFEIGDPLPPLETDFYYKRNGIIDGMTLLIPLHNFLIEPVWATKELIKEFFRSCRGISNFVIDFCLESTAESARFNNHFEATVPPYPSIDSLDINSKSFIFSHNNVGHNHNIDL